MSHPTAFSASATAAVNCAIEAVTAPNPFRLPAAAQKVSCLAIAARMPSAGDVGCSHDSVRCRSVFEAADAVHGEPSLNVFIVHGKGTRHASWGAGAVLMCKHSSLRFMIITTWYYLYCVCHPTMYIIIRAWTSITTYIITTPGTDHDLLQVI